MYKAIQIPWEETRTCPAIMLGMQPTAYTTLEEARLAGRSATIKALSDPTLFTYYKFVREDNPNKAINLHTTHHVSANWLEDLTDDEV
jgi:hypothetical protein